MVSAPDLATNLATAERLIDQAASDGAQLVSLPEFFVQLARLMDGKLLLVTNTADLTPQEVLERYKSLADI